MKFIKVDYDRDGRPLSDEENIYGNTFERRVRLDQFTEFQIVDNFATGSDRSYLITAHLPDEPRDTWGAILAHFDRHELDAAKAYLDKLISEINGD